MALIAGLAFLVPASAPATDSGRVSVGAPTTRAIAPGVTLYEATVAGPNRVHVLTLEPSSPATLDVTTARRSLPGFKPTSAMATRERAIAAINGDFGLYPGRPGHAYAQDASFKQTSLLGIDGKSFATTQDGLATFIDRPDLSITISPDVGAAFLVDDWNNGPPKQHDIMAFTPFGGTVDPVPSGVCAARLVPAGASTWGPAQIGVARPYEVQAQRCGGSPLPVKGAVVLTSSLTGPASERIKNLELGEAVELTWSLGWPGITDTIGGSPLLIEDGQIAVGNCDTYLCSRQPRTAIGLTEEGNILLAVIDGRWSGRSVGMTLKDLAEFMSDQGAVWALNLDGGGSSTMWVKGKGIINRPSDGDERAVSSAIVILPGADPGEPILGPAPAPTLTPPLAVAPSEAAPTRAAPPNNPAPRTDAPLREAMADPGSTGGLLDALARQGQPLDERARDWVRTFREINAP